MSKRVNNAKGIPSKNKGRNTMLRKHRQVRDSLLHAAKMSSDPIGAITVASAMIRKIFAKRVRSVRGGDR